MRLTCRISTIALVVVVLCVLETDSFAPVAISKGQKIHAREATSLGATAASDDAQRLLAKARALKEEAEREAHALHETRLTQKEGRDQTLDRCIDALFPPSSQDDSVEAVAARLKSLQYSTDKLLEIITRLFQLELKAKGIRQVEAFFEQNTHTGFKRVPSEVNEEEAKRIGQQIDSLIQAAEQIDEEYLRERRVAKKARHLSHVELEHWTVGECASILSGKIRELRREHEEQFQERLKSFYAAQRKKDLPPPPEYMP